jgi:hypothetical protein
MKSIVLVPSYTPTNKEQDILRNLVRFLKSNGKHILLVSHSETPQDIIKDANYYFYDYENELLKDDKYKNWFSVGIGNGLLVSKDVLESSTHVLPVMRNLFFGLSIAKMLGYDCAHYLEYDSILKDTSFIDKNTEACQEYDGIFYSRESTYEQNGFDHKPKKHLLGSYSVYNLKSFSFDELAYNRDLILDEFRKSLLVERITQRILIKDKNFLVRDVDGEYIEDGLVDNIVFSGKKLNPKVVFTEDGDFHLYASHSNMTNQEERIMVLINNQTIINFPPIRVGMFHLQRIGKIESTKYIKVFMNDVLIYDYDFSTQEKVEKHSTINFFKKD